MITELSGKSDPKGISEEMNTYFITIATKLSRDFGNSPPQIYSGASYYMPRRISFAVAVFLFRDRYVLMDTCRARGYSVPSHFCMLLVLYILVYVYNITIMGFGGVQKEEVNLIACYVHLYFVIHSIHPGPNCELTIFNYGSFRGSCKLIFCTI